MSKAGTATRGLGAAHDERRRAILDAVFAIIDTDGAEQVSIRNVAQRAGVSIGRVQHYFSSKDDLLTAAFTTITTLGGDRVRDRLTQTPREPVATLRAVLTEMIPHSEDDCRLHRIMQSFEAYARPRPHLAAQVTEGYDGLIELARTLLGGEPDLARELIALTVGLADLVLTGNLTAEQAERIALTRLDQITSA
ncbi:TetR family transcriptional regulator [Nocardia tenerifensis]|uniref:TetR family transcriptional regulator n=1 Tax=Nocardia tenerifensis TaxID=228006 RepID=A0A318JQY3_9NOCA|nr:TetR/AcrR family transcriptional regulator [Nocardia tenerifensis]PXX56507.1 TetR family transcriptional regulator [Nocardia tenerifensis]